LARRGSGSIVVGHLEKVSRRLFEEYSRKVTSQVQTPNVKLWGINIATPGRGKLALKLKNKKLTIIWTDDNL